MAQINKNKYNGRLRRDQDGLRVKQPHSKQTYFLVDRLNVVYDKASWTLITIH